MKKFMIRTDIEGASCVVSNVQAAPGASEFDVGSKGMHSDILAIIDGLRAAGECEIYLYDEHYWGRNIDLSLLPENVFVYCGKPPYTSEWAGGLDESFDGMILMGLHSKAGTDNALLNHTYEGEIADISINGISVGEIGNEAAIAGEFGVPLILVTADSEGIRETKALCADTVCVSVKESTGVESALCYPLEVTRAAITKAAQKAAELSDQINPVRFDGEIEYVVTLRESPFLDKMRSKYFDHIRNTNQVVLKGQSVLETYSRYWEMKASCT